MRGSRATPYASAVKSVRRALLPLAFLAIVAAGGVRLRSCASESVVRPAPESAIGPDASLGSPPRGRAPDGESAAAAKRLGETLSQLRTQRPFLIPTGEESSPASIWRRMVQGCMRSPPKWVSLGEVLARIDASRVVLVADHHTSPIPALAAGQLIETLVGTESSRASPPALLLEMVPRTSQSELSELLARPFDRSETMLRQLLHECWPWPADPIVRLLQTTSGAARYVGAVGWGCSPSSYQAGVEDWRRQSYTMERRAFFLGDTPLDRTDANIMDSIGSELPRHGERGSVIVLVGAYHIIRPEDGLRDRLVAMGISPVIVLPYCPELEIWIREGAREEPPVDRWLEVAEGVYRPPTMTWEVIGGLRNTQGDYWAVSSGEQGGK